MKINLVTGNIGAFSPQKKPATSVAGFLGSCLNVIDRAIF